MHVVGPIRGLDARGGTYKRFGCTWWDLHVLKVWMNRVGPINIFDGQGGSYKRFGWKRWAL